MKYLNPVHLFGFFEYEISFHFKMYKLGVFVLLVSTILTKDVRSHFVTHYTSDKLEEIVAIKTDIQKFLDPLLVPRGIP